MIPPQFFGIGLARAGMAVRRSGGGLYTMLTGDMDVLGDDEEIKCLACKSTIDSDKFLSCTKCKFFLHEKCLDPPLKINHPLHSLHSLAVQPILRKNLTCMVCRRSYKNALTFECHHCKIYMCIKCGTGTSRRTIAYDGHEHLLFFVDKIHSARHLGPCSGYDSYCKQEVLENSAELGLTDSCVIRCMDCSFFFHLLCGPLPSTIKHKCHVDRLALVDSIVEEGCDEFYCDVCEQERDPRLCAYYCEECKFIAHVHCVVPEIQKILTGDLKDVELKVVGENPWESEDEPDETNDNEMKETKEEKIMTVNDIITKLTDKEREILFSSYTLVDISLEDNEETKEFRRSPSTRSELGDEEIARILKLSRFSHEAFENILAEFGRFCVDTKLELTYADLSLHVKRVRGIFVPHALSPVLKKLLRKHGDFSGGESTLEWKSFVYFVVCKVVKRMCSVKTVDITRGLLLEWYYHLRFVKNKAGFSVGFACAHLENLVRAFFGIQARRLEHEVPGKIHLKIAERRKRIAELEKEIEERNRQLKMCREYCGSSPKSDFMIECLSKGSKLKWKNGCEYLLSYEKDSPISDSAWK